MAEDDCPFRDDGLHVYDSVDHMCTGCGAPDPEYDRRAGQWRVIQCGYTERDGALVCTRDKGHPPPHVMFWKAGLDKAASADDAVLARLMRRVLNDPDIAMTTYLGSDTGTVVLDGDLRLLDDTEAQVVSRARYQ